MGRAELALEHGGPKRLVVAWRLGWKDYVVSFDGVQVTSFPGALPPAGATTPLPDGSTLELQLFRGTANGTVLELRRNGMALAGDGPVVDAEGQIRSAANWLYVAAGLSFLVGSVQELVVDAPPAAKIGGIVFLGVYCVVLAVLGFFVGRGSMAAAIAALAVFALDWIATIVVTHNPLAGIVIRLLVAVALYKAIKKIRALRNLEEVPAVFS